MISISRLLCGTISPGDALRYGDNKHAGPRMEKGVPRPVVVWNCTRRCNLKCLHCYASANNQKAPGEMTTAQGRQFITDLAEFGVPVILFSGGEPLLREDLIELAGFARDKGIRVALSTNGTVITEEKARQLAQVGFAEVGISLDGTGPNNDRFRGKAGAYDAALTGIRRCVALGIRVSLRLTMTAYNYKDIPTMLQLIEDEKIDRVCFYHLAYAGRGGSLQEHDLDHTQTRWVLDRICEHTLDMHRRGLNKEVLTVANHTDGIYVYLKYGQDPERGAKIHGLLETNGGNNSGIKIGAVDDLGNVHPDQFWREHSFGNVLERKFGDIWADTSVPLIGALRDRKKLLKGRCSQCIHLDVCNGNLRLRAEAAYGDIWAPDPACYLTDAEIGLNGHGTK